MHVATKWNKEVPNSPNERKLLRFRIQYAIKKGQVGALPTKRGRKLKLPPELSKGLLMQVPLMWMAE